MECCIAGVVPVADNWSGECCIAIRHMLAGKTVTVKLVETLENRIHAVDILLSIGRLYCVWTEKHLISVISDGNVQVKRLANNLCL